MDGSGRGRPTDAPARPSDGVFPRRRGGRCRRPALLGALAVLLLGGCGDDDGTTAPGEDDALVPVDVVAAYLDRSPLPPFDPDDGLARLVACDDEVRPVWRTTMYGATVFDDLRAAWTDLAEQDAGVEVTEPVQFRDGRVHVGLRDGRVRAGATRARFDERSVLVEVRLPCRSRRPGDPATFALEDPTPAEPPDPAFPPQPDDDEATGSDARSRPDPLVVDVDTSPARTTPVTPRDPIQVGGGG